MDSYSDLKLSAQVSRGDYARGEPVAVAIPLRYDSRKPVVDGLGLKLTLPHPSVR
ncbi:MAG: hypothetical protein QW057_02975 [Candidatus Bathyarchaeia archaeon]